MEVMLLRLFQIEVAHHCRHVLAAAHDMQASLVLQDTARFWMAAQTLMVAGANISKALWGVGGRRGDEREPLRRSLAVEDTSCLRPTTFRNHFEHFDERLDRWWAESPTHNYLDNSILTAGSVVGFAENEMFRHFDPQTGELKFWGDTFSVPAIANEAESILRVAAGEASKPHWEPPDSAGGAS